MIYSNLAMAAAEQMTMLPYAAQQSVLNFIQQLRSASPQGVRGDTLLKFAGTISPDDLKLMQVTIEAECERIDHDEW